MLATLVPWLHAAVLVDVCCHQDRGGLTASGAHQQARCVAGLLWCLLLAVLPVLTACGCCSHCFRVWLGLQRGRLRACSVARGPINRMVAWPGARAQLQVYGHNAGCTWTTSRVLAQRGVYVHNAQVAAPVDTLVARSDIRDLLGRFAAGMDLDPFTVEGDTV